jgi:hypothetical protein
LTAANAIIGYSLWPPIDAEFEKGGYPWFNTFFPKQLPVKWSPSPKTLAQRPSRDTDS